MGSCRPSGHADIADQLALADPGAHGEATGKARHVSVERRLLGGVADFNGQPVLEISALMIDDTIGCRKNRLPHARLVINAMVKLPPNIRP